VLNITTPYSFDWFGVEGGGTDSNNSGGDVAIVGIVHPNYSSLAVQIMRTEGSLSSLGNFTTTILTPYPIYNNTSPVSSVTYDSSARAIRFYGNGNFLSLANLVSYQIDGKIINGIDNPFVSILLTSQLLAVQYSSVDNVTYAFVEVRTEEELNPGYFIGILFYLRCFRKPTKFKTNTNLI